jgi:hypothetical protein
VTKLLKPNDRSTFSTYDGKIITGKVVAVMGNCYLVIGDQDICHTYQDGLYRFTDKNIVKESG